MDWEENKENTENKIDSGHQCSVYKSHTISNESPIKKQKSGISNQLRGAEKRLNRELFPQVDLCQEARKQHEIRESLRKIGSEYYRDIPKVDMTDINACSFRMELAPGKKLGDILCFLEPLRFLSIFRRIALFVESIHNCGYAHEDLSFNNIIIDMTDDSIMIIDFELAGKFGDKRTMTGDSEFSDPGKITSPVIDRNGDKYSLGMILKKYNIDILTNNIAFRHLIDAMTCKDLLKRIELKAVIFFIDEMIKNMEAEQSSSILHEEFLDPDILPDF
jgi:serine/threonine protein kinase